MVARAGGKIKYGHLEVGCFTKDGPLSDIAKKMIAGILDVGDVITAFGNPIPISYFRLVPHQEAPTYIC